MSLRQIKRLRLAPKGNRNVLECAVKFPLRRFSLFLRNVFQVYFAHRKEFLIQPDETRPLVAMEKTAIPIQIKFTKEEG